MNFISIHFSNKTDQSTLRHKNIILQQIMKEAMNIAFCQIIIKYIVVPVAMNPVIMNRRQLQTFFFKGAQCFWLFLQFSGSLLKI